MTTSDPKPTSWTIQATGHRVDRELKQMFPSLSNQVIKQWLAQKGVQLNNKYANKGMRVKTGDIITILDPGPIPSQEASFAPVTTQASESLREDILYEDEQVLAWNKPAGLPSHPLTPWETDSCSQRALAHAPYLKEVGETRAPGLLHRLDNETSGVLLFAKSQSIYEMLISSRDASQWQKQYAAWVYGSIPPGTTREIDISIAHHPSNQSKMVALTDKQAHRGKPRTANTLFQSIPYQTNPFPDSVAATPLLINIVQGTRHQIRVHLASIGHPIVGDTLYGPDTREDNGPHESEKRMYLHAFSYTLPSPPLPMAVTVTSLPPFPFPSLDHCETTDQTSQQS